VGWLLGERYRQLTADCHQRHDREAGGTR
jgi:hypothetical protein